MARSTITRTFNFAPGDINLPCLSCLDGEDSEYYSYGYSCDEEKQCNDTTSYTVVGGITTGVLIAEGVDMSQLATATWTASYSVTANDGSCGVDKTYNSPTFGAAMGEPSVPFPRPEFGELVCNSNPWVVIGQSVVASAVMLLFTFNGTSGGFGNVSISITVSVNAEMLDVGPSCFWEQLIGTRELC